LKKLFRKNFSYFFFFYMGVTRVVLEEEPEEVEEESLVSIDLGALCVSDPAPITDATAKGLLATSQENVQRLIDKLLKQPLMKNDKAEKMRGIIYQLPATTTQFPREKRIPRPKPLTRWEKFKKDKGVNTRKKDKLVYDEVSGKWKTRYGRDRANDPMKAPILEVPKGWEPGDPDPFTLLRQEKKERVLHNREKERRNLVEAAGLRAPGAVHLWSAVDYSSNKKMSSDKPIKLDAKSHVDLTYRIAQHSTRSMGKFDPLLKGEEVPTMKQEKRRPLLSKRDEVERNIDVLNMVVGKTLKKKAIVHNDQLAKIEKIKKEKKRHQRNKAVGGRKKKRRIYVKRKNNENA